MMDYIEEVKRLLADVPEDDLLVTEGPVDADLILVYEQRMNVKFPASYVAFLSTYCAIGVYGHEIFGICAESITDTPSSYPDLCFANLEARKSGSISDQMILVEDSNGIYFSIDLSTIGSKGEPVVVETTPWGFKENGEKIIVADSFADFLLETVKDTREY